MILYFSDAFKKPCPFEPHVVVDIGPEFDHVVGMLHCHESQFYEWLPFNAGHLDQVPKENPARRAWLADRFGRRIRPLADRYRDRVIQTYGKERGEQVEFVEAFEVSEFGAPWTPRPGHALFPFLPTTSASSSPFARKDWVDLPEEE